MRATLPTLVLGAAAAAAATAAPAPARAQAPEAAPGAPTDDGYCDYAQGVAAAESALAFAPEVFVQYGRVDQAESSSAPTADPGSLRFIGGLRWRLSGIYEGLALRGRAAADCRRHRALEAVRGEPLRRALAARAQVLEAALPEAAQLLAQAGADLDARRLTAQEATATRVRVEELRRLAAEAREALRALPAAPAGDPAGALAAFRRADAEVERRDAQLRRARGIDLSVRLGVDRYLDGAASDTTPVFAVATLGVNLGLLFQGSGNQRAAAGRRRLAAAGRDPVAAAATAALAEATARRAQDTAALEADLTRQLEALGRVGGEDSKRYRAVVWFELVKARAEHAYHEARLGALRQVQGQEPSPEPGP